MKKILNLFKKTKEIPIKEIELGDLEIWFTQKRTDLHKFTKEINHELKNLLFVKLKIFKSQLDVLNEIKVSSINERERIKSIVKENLSNYTKNFEKLINELENLNEKDDFLRKLNEYFYHFEKKTRVNFQKATYLIGKELGDIRQTTDDLFSEINKIVKRNQKEFDDQKNFTLLESKLKGYHEIEELKSELKQKMRKVTSQLDEENEKKDLINMEIEKLKKSPAYQKEIEKREIQELLKKSLNSEIISLKDEINFKELAQFFHKYEKDMSTINSYKENWIEKLKEKNATDLIDLLIQANINTIKISEKLNRIKKIKADINSTSLSDIGFARLELDLEKVSLGIKDSQKEKESLKRLIEKQDENLIESLGLVNEQLLYFNYTIKKKNSPKNI